MGFSVAARNAMLSAVVPDYASLHTGDPGANGTVNEVTGGSPAYARKSVTWGAPAAGSMAASNTPVFDVPACTVSYVGWWKAGVFQGSDDVTPEAFAGQGTYTLTSQTLSVT